ncbi:MAG: hypothetical protein KJ941_09030 [Bacteroidetes bacterium]|nr:hypothetical protein [Bacteroidota bacterium]
MILRLWIFFSLLSFSSWSQDSLVETSTIPDTIHSVRKATLLSLVLPGAGQVYNYTGQAKGQKKGLWKIPLIYAGLGFTGYSIVKNQIIVSSLKTEYRSRENGVFEDERWITYDQNGIVTLYSQYSRKRDLAIMGLILVYGFQIADAAVQAHFVNFDISEDLSLSIFPKMTDFRSVRVGFTFNFR